MSSIFKYFIDLFDICYFYSEPNHELSEDSKRLYEMTEFTTLHNSLILKQDMGYGSLLARMHDLDKLRCHNIKLLNSDGTHCFSELNFTENFIFLTIFDEDAETIHEFNIINLDDYFNALLLIHSDIQLPTFDDLTELQKTFKTMTITNNYWSIIYGEGEEENYGY